MSTYIIRGQDEIWRNLLREMGEAVQSGKALEVCCKPYKTCRSKAQNAVFHMWAEDVSAATGDDRRGGRLKLQYFVPVLLREDEAWAWVWQQTGAKLSYEKQVAFLVCPTCWAAQAAAIQSSLPKRWMRSGRVRRIWVCAIPRRLVWTGGLNEFEAHTGRRGVFQMRARARELLLRALRKSL